eukprot:GEMP01002030.1.p1 GENE.GEMP01002030.1~~GEMP01002030.1.p1  ORF type:complete len:1565 (+),score=337.85 GEMP01002030.1:37-4731(+)
MASGAGSGSSLPDNITSNLIIDVKSASKGGANYDLQPISWLRQVWWMIRKNYNEMWTRRKYIVLQSIFPLYAAFWLILMKSVFPDNRELSFDVHKTTLNSIQSYIRVAPSTAAATQIASLETILRSGQATAPTFIKHETVKEMLDEYSANPAKTFAAIEFDANSIVISFNRSLTHGFLDNDGQAELKFKKNEIFPPAALFINNGIADLRLAVQQLLINDNAALVDLNNPKLEAGLNFIKPQKTCEGVGCILKYVFPALLGATFFISLQIMVISIGTEKGSGFFDSLGFTGLHKGPYWIATLLARMPILFLPTLFMVGGLYATLVLKESNPLIVFIAIYLIGLHSTATGIIIGSVVSSCAQAMGLGMAMLIISQGLFYVVEFFYIQKGASRAGVIATFLAPGVATGRFGWELASLEGAGDGMQWDNLGEYTGATFYMLIVTTVFYLLLSIYFDYVIPREGAPQTQSNPFFFLTRSFWFTSHTLDIDQHAGVLARGVEKFFQVPDVKTKNIFGMKKNKTLKAVDGIDMDLNRGEILVLLGHNGAGKTTLIKCLTGQTVPTKGEITVGGLPACDARKHIGMCPQFDIVNNDLTAYQHLQLFGALKGIPLANLDAEIDDMLSSVGLQQVGRDTPVGDFSGGMKRRLSVCLSLIGKPVLLLLDEPSTGIDPVNRRRLWELLQRKTDTTSVLLTTHSMEEADWLGTRVTIMAGGKEQASGTSLELKQRYGIGYNLSLKTSDAKSCTDVVNEHVKEANVLTEVGEEISYSLPIDAADSLPALFDGLAACEAVKSTSMSMSTLEEAFMELGKEAVSPEEVEEEKLEEEARSDAKGLTLDVLNGDFKPTCGQKISGQMKLVFLTLIRNPTAIFFTWVVSIIYSVVLVSIAAALRGEDPASLVKLGTEPSYFKGTPLPRMGGPPNCGGPLTYTKYDTADALNAAITSGTMLFGALKLPDSATTCRDNPTVYLNASLPEYDWVHALNALYPTEPMKIELRELPAGPTAVVDMSSFYGGALLIILAFILGLQSAVYGEDIVRDRVTGLKDVLLVSGISRVYYFVAHSIAHACFYIIPFTICMVVCAIGQMEFIYENNWVTIILLCIASAPAVVSFGYALSLIFHDLQAAQEWLQELINLVLSILYLLAVFSQANISVGVQYAMSLAPPYGVYRAFAILQTAAANKQGLTFTDVWDSDKEFIIVIAALITSPFIWFSLVVVNEIISYRREMPKADNDKPCSSQGLTAALEVRGASKYFKRKNEVFKAVDDVDVTLDTNCMLGLLGLNGAGKTTLISMVTGVQPPTHGDAWINGASITKNREAARMMLGNCSQHDHLFEFLTGRELLTAVAELRGVPKDIRKEYVKKLLADFRLTPKADAVVHTYSGGNKRKLSLALSTVGSTRVVLLDEPTTGMDTNTRRKVWESLMDLKQRSAVVLTTHSMEEADALCSCIFIMVNGKICVKGTSQDLKAKYGSGYRVAIRSPKVDAVRALVQKLWAQAEFVSTASSLTCSAFDVHIKMMSPSDFARFFREMENVKEELDISEYSLSQATLDHVFVNFNATQLDRNVGDSSNVLPE